jgi:hypothetical protein
LLALLLVCTSTGGCWLDHVITLICVVVCADLGLGCLVGLLDCGVPWYTGTTGTSEVRPPLVSDLLSGYLLVDLCLLKFLRVPLLGLVLALKLSWFAQISLFGCCCLFWLHVLVVCDPCLFNC